MVSNRIGLLAAVAAVGLGSFGGCKQKGSGDPEESPRGEPGVAAELAVDTAFVVSISVTSLRTLEQWNDIYDLVAARELLPLEEIRDHCGFALFDRLTRVSITGDASWEPDRAGIILHGVERAAADECAVTLAREIHQVELEIDRGDPITTYRDRASGLELYAAWLDDRSVLLTPADVQRRALLAARLGDGSTRPGETVTLYSVAGPDSLIAAALAPPLDTPIAEMTTDLGAGARAAHVRAHLTDGLALEAGLHYADTAAATRGAAELTERLHAYRQDPILAPYATPARITHRGDHVTLSLQLDAARTSQAVRLVLAQLPAPAAAAPE
ncbi:MAG TPA: hypothetical protein VML75_14285 [Kofleriaceae bacterium]|nr:hypothetical protein [Kofleriaceae bacterium]